MRERCAAYALPHRWTTEMLSSPVPRRCSTAFGTLRMICGVGVMIGCRLGCASGDGLPLQ